jgi:hypothetical protein
MGMFTQPGRPRALNTRQADLTDEVAARVQFRRGTIRQSRLASMVEIPTLPVEEWIPRARPGSNGAATLTKRRAGRTLTG